MDATLGGVTTSSEGSKTRRRRTMDRGPRIFIGVVLGFILYRISVEFLNVGTAVVLGLLVVAVTWEITGRLARRDDEKSDPRQ